MRGPLPFDSTHLRQIGTAEEGFYLKPRLLYRNGHVAEHGALSWQVRCLYADGVDAIDLGPAFVMAYASSSASVI